ADLEPLTRLVEPGDEHPVAVVELSPRVGGRARVVGERTARQAGGTSGSPEDRTRIAEPHAEGPGGDGAADPQGDPESVDHANPPSTDDDAGEHLVPRRGGGPLLRHRPPPPRRRWAPRHRDGCATRRAPGAGASSPTRSTP